MKTEGGLILDTQESLKKKTTVLRSWILIDTNGESKILEMDKYDIMQRVPIYARDLRNLEPLLSCPYAILGRDKAIILNLEHIRAIITTEEVMLQDPLDDNVVPVVQELRRRLPLVNPISQGQGEDGENLRSQNDIETSAENEFPFELRALEVALEAVCSFLSAKTTDLEVAAYPALDELTSKLREYIDNTEDYLNIQLDHHRNQLIQLELILSSGNVSLSIYALVTAIFGMNIVYTWNKHYGYMFKWVVILSGIMCAFVFLAIIIYARRKRLIGSWF